MECRNETREYKSYQKARATNKTWTVDVILAKIPIFCHFCEQYEATLVLPLRFFTPDVPAHNICISLEIKIALWAEWQRTGPGNSPLTRKNAVFTWVPRLGTGKKRECISCREFYLIQPVFKQTMLVARFQMRTEIEQIIYVNIRKVICFARYDFIFIYFLFGYWRRLKAVLHVICGYYS